MANAISSVCHETVTSACEQNCCLCLHRLIEEGHSIDGMNNLGWRPLHICALKNNVPCLNLLLRQDDCDVDWKSFEDETALMIAVSKGNLESCRELVLAGANLNARNCLWESVLYCALRNNQHSCVRFLCEQKVRLETLDFSQELPLNYAAEECDVNMLTILLNYGADVCHSFNEEGYSPLMSALNAGAIDNFLFLMHRLEETCDRASVVRIVNHRTADNSISDCPGLSSLCLAARLPDPQAVKVLLRSGADPNLFVKKKLAISWAFAGHIDCFRMLLSVTCKDALSEYFDGILVFAAAYDRERALEEGYREGERLQLLVNTGVDINQRRWLVVNDDDHPSLLRAAKNENDRDETHGARSINSMYGRYFTFLTLMLRARAPLSNIEIMINAGARWHHRRDHTADCVPPHFFLYDADILKLLIRGGMNPNLYNVEYFAFNIAVMTVFPYPDLLSTWLLHGGEAESCFNPIPNFEDAWTFNEIANRYKCHTVMTLHFGDEVEIVDFYKSLLVLLKYVAAPGYLSWMLDSLIEDDDERFELEKICCTPSSLMHLSRVKIRHLLTYKYLCDANILMETLMNLNLPIPVIEYISYSRTV